MEFHDRKKVGTLKHDVSMGWGGGWRFQRNEALCYFYIHCTFVNSFLASYELPEFALVRELVYVFQGIEGRYIKFDETADQFKVDSEVSNMPLITFGLFAIFMFVKNPILQEFLLEPEKHITLYCLINLEKIWACLNRYTVWLLSNGRNNTELLK